MVDQKNKDTQNTKAWWQPAMVLFLRMSVCIVVPVVAAIFAGKWFDNKYDTEPWGLLGILGLSFLSSMFIIVKIVLQEYKNIEKEEDIIKEGNKNI